MSELAGRTLSGVSVPICPPPRGRRDPRGTCNRRRRSHEVLAPAPRGPRDRHNPREPAARRTPSRDGDTQTPVRDLCVGAHAPPLDHRGRRCTPTAQHQGGWHPDERALPGRATEVAAELVARAYLGAVGGCHAGDAWIALQSARPATRVPVAEDHPAVDGGTGQPRESDVELRGRQGGGPSAARSVLSRCDAGTTRPRSRVVARRARRESQKAGGRSTVIDARHPSGQSRFERAWKQSPRRQGR